jgi:hypothetical protein
LKKKKRKKIKIKKAQNLERNTKWGKEHQVRGKRIKLQLIKHAEDVESTLIIVERSSALVVALEELPNYDNPVGEIGTVPLMAIKGFIDKRDLLAFFSK